MMHPSFAHIPDADASRQRALAFLQNRQLPAHIRTTAAAAVMRSQQQTEPGVIVADASFILKAYHASKGEVWPPPPPTRVRGPIDAAGRALDPTSVAAFIVAANERRLGKA